MLREKVRRWGPCLTWARDLSSYQLMKSEHAERQLCVRHWEQTHAAPAPLGKERKRAAEVQSTGCRTVGRMSG